jgi:aminopeptidase N
MEASSGRNLSQYFSDWYYGQGYPTYTINWSQVGDTATVELDQLASFPSSVPFFALPVPVRFKNASQSLDVVLDNTTNGQIFKIYVPFVSDSLKLDPDRWIITGPADVVTANDAPSLAPSFEIYPNPAAGYVNLRGTQLDEMALFDLAGTRLFDLALQRNVQVQRVDLPALPKGMYMMRLRAGNRFFTQKLILD